MRQALFMFFLNTKRFNQQITEKGKKQGTSTKCQKIVIKKVTSNFHQ